MGVPKDLSEFIASLNSHKVEFVVVGAHALAFHGHPRYTGDLDIFVRPTAQNASRLEDAIAPFGFVSLGLKASDFLHPNRIVQLGVPPNRIDLLTTLSGLTFDEAWEVRVTGELGGQAVAFLNRDSLIKKKRATGRLKDAADIEALGSQESS
jgi:hypothetical protein